MSAQADIRKWFLKKPDHDQSKKDQSNQKTQPDSSADASNAYKKESKFFNGDKSALKLGKKSQDVGKRKSDQGVENSAGKKGNPSPKKPRLAIPAPEGDDTPEAKEDVGRVKSKKSDNLPRQNERETPPKPQARGRGAKEETPAEKPAAKTPARGRGRGKKVDDDDEDTLNDTPQSTGRGRGRGKSPSDAGVLSPPEKQAKTAAPTGGRGRGRGRGKAVADAEEDDEKPSVGRGGGRGGGAPWAQPRGTPPHKGEKEVPQGAENCLAGLTFVISGTLDSLEREEAEVLIKSHGGRVTGSVSKKTDYLLADEDVGGRKSQKAKELGVKFLTEDNLFANIIASKPKQSEKSPAKSSPAKTSRGSKGATAAKESVAVKASPSGAGNSASGRSIKNSVPTGKLPPPKSGSASDDNESWPDKYQPKTSADLVGNPGIIKQLKDWLQKWDSIFLQPVSKGKKGKRGDGGSSSGSEKKAVILSGPPGIGKTTTARLVCRELGYVTLEVNASDSRGKADSKIKAGMGGSTANTIKEMVNNESISFKQGASQAHKSVLIMDEVDGMSGGDRGGVADLIASIKSSRIPIICICNDKFSQKLKSLQNYCLPLPYRKATKQQVAKRLLQIAKAEGIQVDEVTLEDVGERTNGDMRMALNQLQYMSLQTRALKYADVHSRLLASSKDEDISPFSAADKLLGFDGGRLRMDERVDLVMSDMDLVPLFIQENYLNFGPSAASQDSSGLKLMNLAARAAASIADGDVVNKQIRRYQQWQHSQTGAFLSTILPAALMHGRRMEYEGGRNFNRFPGWLGKNSTFGKRMRLLEDVHIHLLASRVCEPTREVIRMGYLPLLALNLSHPLKHLPKETAVEEIVGLMEEYSLNMEDYEAIMEISKFKGQPDLLEGVPPAVKTALTKYYKQREQDRPVRSADLLPVMALPFQKKTPKKPARLKLTAEDPVDEELGNDGEADEVEEVEEEEEEETAEEPDSILVSNGMKGVTVDFDDQKGTNGTKTPKAKTPKRTPGKNAATPAGKRKR